MEKHRIQNAESPCCCWRTRRPGRLTVVSVIFWHSRKQHCPSAAAKGFGVLKPSHRSFGFLLDIPESNARHWMALAASAVWGFGVSKPVFLHPHVVLAFFLTFHKATLGIICWMMRRPGPLGLPVPNIAFWNVKKAKTTMGTETNRGFETPNPNPTEGGGGPAGWGCQCQTLLSGMSKRKPKLQVDVEIGFVCNWTVHFHAGKQLG